MVGHPLHPRMFRILPYAASFFWRNYRWAATDFARYAGYPLFKVRLFFNYTTNRVRNGVKPNTVGLTLFSGGGGHLFYPNLY